MPLRDVRSIQDSRHFVFIQCPIYRGSTPIALILIKHYLRTVSRNPPPTTSLSSPLSSGVKRILRIRIHLDHLLPQLWVVIHHDLRIPCHCDKDGVDATANRGREDVGDLEANKECESNNDRRERSVRVVGWSGEDQVQIRQ